MRTETCGEKAGVVEADGTLLSGRRVVSEVRVVNAGVGEGGPVLREKLIGEFLIVPLVGLQDVEAEILAVDVDETAYLIGLLVHFCEEFLVADELGLELLAVLLVHAELAGAAGVGVGVA
jgi:hypothetical protein